MKIVKAIQLLINEARMNRVYAGKGIAVSRGPRGTLVSCLETEGGGGGTGYDGFFTIKLKVVDGDTYAFVCDGATWNEENETSGNSPIYVNNRYYLVPMYKHPTPITTNTSIAIHWKNAIPADEYATPPVAATPATASILFTNNPLPQDSPTEIYRQIGRILYSNGVANVIQDHTSGVMYAVVYAICSYK